MQNTRRHEGLDFTVCRILRHLADLRPLRGREVPVKPIQQAIEHLALMLIEVIGRMPTPELGLGKNHRQAFFGRGNRPRMASQEPKDPTGHIKRIPLSMFDLGIIIILLGLYLRRKRIETQLALFSSCQPPLRQCPGKPSITVFERMKRKEMQMR